MEEVWLRHEELSNKHSLVFSPGDMTKLRDFPVEQTQGQI